MMELKLCWLYNDMLDLYGDKGNIKVLKKRCEDRDIKFSLTTISINEETDLSEYHLVFIGGGADREQALIYKDLIARKDNIISAINNNTFFLLICGGYQLFGAYYIDQDGKKIDGLNIYDYYTESNTNGQRCIGNIAIKCTLGSTNMTLVGFENHGGQTKGVTNPLGEVLSGHGNEYMSKHEGVFDKQVIGTYMHGPLLPKNPELADYIIKRALMKEYDGVNLKELDDTFEIAAKKAILSRLNIAY